MQNQLAENEVRIFIMRHGEAESLYVEDRERQLTKRGITQVDGSAHWLKHHYFYDCNIDLAFVSPYVRAQQTFQCLSESLVVDQQETCGDITPDGQPNIMHDFIDASIQMQLEQGTKPSNILIVSHMPFVSYFLDEMLVHPRSALFATASVAVLSYNIKSCRGELLAHYQGQR